MSEKFVNRRRERRMGNAVSRYNELEKLIENITISLEEAKIELDDSVKLLEKKQTKNPTPELERLESDFDQLELDLNLLSEDFENLEELFEEVEEMKEEINLERSSNQNRLLRRVDAIYEHAEEFLEEVENLRDDIFELSEDLYDGKKKQTKEKHEFKSVEDISGIINEAFAGIRNVFVDLGGSKGNSIAAMLAFLGEKEKKELVEMILEDKEETKDLKLSTVFPFLEESDCDKIFIAKMKTIPTKDLTALFPFVSSAALDKMVDEYLDGNFEGLNMTAVYPFLDQETIKKIFYHELNKQK